MVIMCPSHYQTRFDRHGNSHVHKCRVRRCFFQHEVAAASSEGEWGPPSEAYKRRGLSIAPAAWCHLTNTNSAAGPDPTQAGGYW
eukprot:13077317-Alexandrium_andersonii.AAC.1